MMAPTGLPSAPKSNSPTITAFTPPPDSDPITSLSDFYPSPSPSAGDILSDDDGLECDEAFDDGC